MYCIGIILNFAVLQKLRPPTSRKMHTAVHEYYKLHLNQISKTKIAVSHDHMLQIMVSFFITTFILGHLQPTVT